MWPLLFEIVRTQVPPLVASDDGVSSRLFQAVVSTCLADAAYPLRVELYDPIGVYLNMMLGGVLSQLVIFLYSSTNASTRSSWS